MYLHIVRNTVTNDSRVLKETGTIIDNFSDSKLIISAFHEPGAAEREFIGKREVHRVRLKSRFLPKDLLSQFIKLLEWRVRLIDAYGKMAPKIVHCHDLDPLPIAVKLKKLTGAKLIYDAHELETERNGLRGLRKRIYQWQEHRLLQYVDHIITVSPSIREWYMRRHPSVPISLVRNIPEKVNSHSRNTVLRSRLGVPDDAILFLYLGGISKGRGVEALLDGFSQKGVKHHILFLGAGPLQSQVKFFSSQCHRIHFQQPVPPEEVTAYACGADVGVCLYEDTCLNHRYCLPNKLFESLQSGLPVLASNLPDQAGIVKNYQAGWVIEPDTEALRKFLLQVTITDVQDLSAGLLDRTKDLQWKGEARTLLQVYSELTS